MRAMHAPGEGFGAGDGIRTRDNLLGRQELYQTELPPPLRATHSNMRAWTEPRAAVAGTLNRRQVLVYQAHGDGPLADG